MLVDVAVKIDPLAELKRRAQEFRTARAAAGTLVVHLLSSPGAGKTALLEATARAWPDRVAVLVGDLATSRDAARLAPVAAVEQITTGGACHLEIPLVERAFAHLPPGPFDYLFIEDVGNLVCPAMHDVGYHCRVILHSVTEGDDKPAKYPKAFRTADAHVITKMDLLPHVPFSVRAAQADAREIQPNLVQFALAALTGTGLENWFQFLEEQRTLLLDSSKTECDVPRQTGPC